MQQADVVVIGAGSIGSMALWQLSQHSELRIIGVDAYPRLNLNSSYAGESRLFRAVVKEGAVFNEHVDTSIDLWRELEETSGRPILHQCGMLSIGPSDFEDMRVTRQIAEDHDLPHEQLTTDELFSRFPQFSPDSHDVGILDPRGGLLRPEVAVSAAQLAAEANGAELHFRTKVTELIYKDDGVEVATTNGSFQADRVIVAVGSWTSRLLPEVGPYVEVRPIGSTWAMPHDIDSFTPEVFPGFIRDRVHDDGEVSHWFGVPSLDGYSIKIGFYPEPGVTSSDVNPDEQLEHYPPEDLSYVGEMLTKCIPDLIPSPVQHSVHHDSYASNEMPIIDRLAADERVWYATGMYGVAFKFTAAYGKMLTDMVLNGSSPLWRSEFSLTEHDKL